MQNLRDYGFGRRFDELELEMNEEIVDFIHMLRNGPRYEHEMVGIFKQFNWDSFWSLSLT